MIEFIQNNPRLGIVGIAILVSLCVALVQFFVLDKEKVRSLKAKQKHIQAQMKEHKHDVNKSMELQKELLAHSMENIKHTFKPLLITLIPILIVFSWMKGIFAETVISGSWFWYYLVASIVASMVFRKVFKLP